MRVAGEEGVVIGPPVENRALEARDGAGLPAGPLHGGEQPEAEPGLGREQRPAPGPPAGGARKAPHQGIEPLLQAGTIGDEGCARRHVGREEGLRDRRAEPGDVGAQGEGQKGGDRPPVTDDHRREAGMAQAMSAMGRDDRPRKERMRRDGSNRQRVPGRGLGSERGNGLDRRPRRSGEGQGAHHRAALRWGNPTTGVERP